MELGDGELDRNVGKRRKQIIGVDAENLCGFNEGSSRND